MGEQLGKWIAIFGACLILLGFIIYYFHDALHWVGRLPGDIRIERDDFRLYIPITTMLLFSIVLTLFLWALRWLNR